MKKTFSTREAVCFGWNTMKENFWFFAGVILILYGLPFVLGLAASFLSNPELGGGIRAIAIIIRIVSWAVQLIMTIGVIQIALKLFDKKKVNFLDLFIHYRFFWKYLWASIVFAFAAGGVLFITVLFFFVRFQLVGNYSEGPILHFITILLGLMGIMGIVIAVFFSIRLKFFSFFIVDKNFASLQSIKASYQATKEVFWQLLGFFALMLLLNIAGALIFLVGLFVTIPITLLATCFVYRKLFSQTKLDIN